MMAQELTCRIEVEQETVFMARGNNPVGHICRRADGGPELMLYANQSGLVTISMNDIEVAMDNWHQMQELRRVAEVAPFMKETLDRV